MEFRIETEFITLGQLLKAAGFVDRGVDAKLWIAEGKIRVNGEKEDRRGRKLFPGDEVRLPNGTRIKVER